MLHESFLQLHQFVFQNKIHYYISQEFSYNYSNKPLTHPILNMIVNHNFNILLITNLFWEIKEIMRGLPSLVKGVRFRSLSLRSSWVQIPFSAFYLSNFFLIFSNRRLLIISPDTLPLNSFIAIPINGPIALSF